MSLDNAVVMATRLEEAAVKLGAQLARKSSRRARPTPATTVFGESSADQLTAG